VLDVDQEVKRTPGMYHEAFSIQCNNFHSDRNCNCIPNGVNVFLNMYKVL
jgi:hypothetical protein